MVWYWIGVNIINITLHGSLEVLNSSYCIEKIFQKSKRNFVSPRGHVISSSFFFAYGISNYACNRSLYYIDVQVFGGKLAKNSFTRCWIFARFHVRWYIPWVSWYGRIWSLQGSSYICISGWNLTFFVTRHLIKSLLHKEETLLKISGKEVDLERNLFHKQHIYHQKSINIQQSFRLGHRASLYREGLINVDRNLQEGGF